MTHARWHFEIPGLPPNWAACGSMGYAANPPLLATDNWNLVDCSRCRASRPRLEALMAELLLLSAVTDQEPK